MRNWMKRWLTKPVLAVAVLAGTLGAASAQAQSSLGLVPPSPGVAPQTTALTLRQTFNAPGESKPIIIDADEITTWVVNGQRVILLRGRVLVTQNVVQVRLQQGVAWIDADNFKRTGILHLELYGEGAVSVDNSTEVKQAERAVLDLNTRGELKLNSHVKPVVQKTVPDADDPLFKHGQAERVAPAAPAKLPARPKTVVPSPVTPKPPVGPIAPKPPVSTGPITPSPVSMGTITPPPVSMGSETTTPTIQRTSFQEVAPTTEPRETTVGETGQGPSAPPAPSSTLPGNGIPPGATLSAPLVPTGPESGTLVPGAPLLAGPGPPLPPPSTPGVRPPVVIASPTRQFSVLPRSANGYNITSPPSQPGDDGLQMFVVTGGVIVNVRNATGAGMLDMEADRLVIWTKGLNTQQIFSPNTLTPENDGNRHLEFYLAGNVVIRQQVGVDAHILRADEAYYDTNRNVAIAKKAQLEFKPRLLTDPIDVNSEELIQHAPSQYEVTRAEIFSSKLPSDPGLKVFVQHATIDDKTVPKLGTFGTPVINRATGLPDKTQETIFKGENVVFELENVPFFYSPYLSGNAREPLGPVQEINFGYSKPFGFQLGATLNLYNLLGIQPFEDTKWRLLVDYLTARGPALGTDFEFTPKELFGMPVKTDGRFTAYGIYDKGYDIIGPRVEEPANPPELRGRALFRAGVYELPYGFSVQTQVGYVSDRNFLEQYFNNEWLTDVNQSTYLYVKQAPEHANYALTGLIEPRLGREWVTQTESLPRLDGYLIGQSFFDLISYNAHGSLGYYQLHTSNDGLPPVSPTDVFDRTGRLDLMQEASIPFTAGPFRFAPYAKLDLTEYTTDLYGQEIGRVYGGGGLRASIPFTRLYPDVQSELWNLNEINHKMVFGMNYYVAKSNEPYTRFPQLDRLNDDETDQALRDFRPYLPQFYPGLVSTVAASKLFDPQLFAIRQLVDSRIDTLDTIEEVQLDLRQRLQTKRGYPGEQHIEDWMVLDLSATYFPDSKRDNFNENWAFLQYDYVWNIGNRTTLTSTGWVDPIENGPRVFTVGAYLNRTDRTTFFLGYRYIDPIDSRAVTAAATYVFSPKYAMTASSTYDFGTQQAQSNSLVFTRSGSDLQVSAGITYNALVHSLGVLFEVVPNLVPANRRVGPITAAGGPPGALGAR